MQLTSFSDYALRLALYLAAHEDRLVPLEEVSRAYGISKHHLAKVAALLLEHQVIESVRGRGGGVRLARAPRDVNVGWLVRQTEPHLDLVECFDPKNNTCPIAPACGLRGVLERARQAFLDSLDGHTLADLAPRPERLLVLWNRQRGGAAPALAARRPRAVVKPTPAPLSRRRGSLRPG